MAIPRLTTDNTCLLVVDVQERLVPEMVDPDRLVDRCRFMVEIATVLDLPIAMTEQYVKGIGPTVPAVREVLPESALVVEKTVFSACVDPVLEWLAEVGRPNVLVVGMEAHVCILQTGLDLLGSGRGVFLVSDAISGGEKDQIAPAFQRMALSGAIVTGCVSATYEMLHDSRHPKFKACLPIVKRIRGV